jgi:hypothetical protein
MAVQNYIVTISSFHNFEFFFVRNKFQVLQRLESSSGDEKDSVSSQKTQKLSDNEKKKLDNGGIEKKKFDIGVDEKQKLEASLNDLCFKLKAVSQRNVNELRRQRGFSEGPAGLTGLGTTGFGSSRKSGSRPPLRKATSLLDAREALEESCSR